MNDETMVERVARAIAKAHDYREGDVVDGVEAWHIFSPDARAAIEAMREPTEAMVTAILHEAWNSGYIEQGRVYDDGDSDPAILSPEAPAKIWAAMVDAALASPPLQVHGE